MQHEHLQGAAKVQGMDAGQFTKWLKKELGWTNNKDFNVKTKTLTEKDGDSFEFQVGYCMKDLGKRHFRCAMKNITEEVIQQAFTEYLIRGSEADMKEKVVVNVRNVFFRASQYYRMKTRFKAAAEVPEMQHVLLAMIRSGKYVLDPKMIEKVVVCIPSEPRLCGVYTLHLIWPLYGMWKTFFPTFP